MARAQAAAKLLCEDVEDLALIGTFAQASLTNSTRMQLRNLTCRHVLTAAAMK